MPKLYIFQFLQELAPKYQISSLPALVVESQKFFTIHITTATALETIFFTSKIATLAYNA